MHVCALCVCVRARACMSMCGMCQPVFVRERTRARAFFCLSVFLVYVSVCMCDFWFFACVFESEKSKLPKGCFKILP